MYTDDLTSRLHNTMEQRVTKQKERIEQLVQSHALKAVKQKVTSNHDKVNHLTKRLEHQQEVYFMQKYEQVNKLRHQLELQNPNAALEQGYSRIWQEEKWVKSLDESDADKELTIEWDEGKIDVNS